jgi:type IX secretion system substrate protein/dockerin type I repeat protein
MQMKKIITLPFLLLLLAPGTIAQTKSLEACTADYALDFLHGNNVRTVISNSGSLFWDGSDGGFFVPFDPSAPYGSSFFVEGLWLGAVTPDGELRTAGMTYGLGNNNVDFWPGPLDESGITELENCTRWNRIWSVRRSEIEAHLMDYFDNQVVNNPLPAIFSWPGKGNPFFEEIFGFPLPTTSGGFAPFFDRNGDGIYDPMDGDYPSPEGVDRIPEQILWCVFNDQGGGALHGETNGIALGVEVQLTVWAFQCDDNPVLNNAVFTAHKIVNRGTETLDSLHIGFFDDFDLGCFVDDGIGSSPSLDTYFAYNLDNNDGDTTTLCFGVPLLGENLPAQSVTFLNRQLDYFMPLNPDCVGGPNTDLEFYSLLTGYTYNGPLTYGENGCNPDNPATNLAFPGDPNNPGEWTMLSVQMTPFDIKSVGSAKLGTLQPGESATLVAARTYHRGEGLTNLENVTLMYDEVAQIRDLYTQGFASGCLQLVCVGDCVWPGDANGDGVANYRDLLPIGSYLGATGPLRAASFFWAPFTASGWNGSLPDGTNLKHADCDGDGEITPQDFKLSDLNYGLTTPAYTAPPDVYQAGPELYITAAGTADFDHIEPGQSLFARINLSKVPDLFGLAFQLELDERYFIKANNFSQGYDVFPEKLTFHSPPIVDFPKVIFDNARVLTNPDSSISDGQLFTLSLKAKEVFDEPLPDAQTPIRFKNIKAIRSDGSIIDIGGTTTWATFENVPVEAVEQLEKNKLVVFPNPATDQLHLFFPGTETEEIAIFNTAGQLLYFDGEKKGDAYTIDLPPLPQGLYFLRLRLNGYYVTEKFVVGPRP